MDKEEELNEIVAELKREQARKWRKKNKAKTREITKRYWLKKAQAELEKREKQKKEGE